MHFSFTLSVTDITIENSDSFNDTTVAKGQESGPSKKQVGHRTGPLLRYGFSMSHSCICVFNPRRMREGYGSWFVCLSACLSVCLLPR